jgi:hypothetical protein
MWISSSVFTLIVYTGGRSKLLQPADSILSREILLLLSQRMYGLLFLWMQKWMCIGLLIMLQ